MTDEVRRILMKEVYTIQDVAKIVDKTTATVRSWEVKKITPKHKNKSDNGWKTYTRRDLEELLNALLNYKWERTVIKNEQDLEFIQQLTSLTSSVQSVDGKLLKLDDIDEDLNTIKAGLQKSLLYTLRGIRYELVDRGWCTTEEKIEFQEAYNAYHALGENGVADSYKEEVMNLPEKRIGDE